MPACPCSSSAIRSSTSRARRSRRTVSCARSASIRHAADRGAAARQPAERSRAAAAGHARRGREDRGADCHSAQFVIARAPSLDDRLFSRTKWSGARPVEVLARTDDVLAIADVAITASGTATVQAALHGRPMVVVYRLVAADLPARPPVCACRHVAMVNLIAGRRIVPELIQDDCTAENIAAETLSLLTNRERAEETRRGARRCAREARRPRRERPRGRGGARGSRGDLAVAMRRRRGGQAPF